MKKLPSFYIYLTLIIALSIGSFIFFFSNNQIHLAYGDARSRLNIALRVTQNLTPGLVQLGGVWLPFPQILQTPLVLSRFLYTTGAAGYIISGLAFIITGILIYKLIFLYTKSNLSAFIGGLIFATSINMLYLQTTALAEPFFSMSIVGATYFLARWAFEKSFTYLPIAGFFVALATLTRYEGYAVFAASVLIVGTISILSNKSKIKHLESNLILFVTVAALGVAIWLVYNWLIFGHPFQSFMIYAGRASVLSTESVARSLAAKEGKARSLSTALEGVSSITIEMVGIFIIVIGIIGFLYIVIKRLISLKTDSSSMIRLLPLFVLLAPLSFLLFTFYFGGPNALYPELNAKNLFNRQFNFANELNIRYGIQSLPFFVVFIGLLINRSKIVALFVLIIASLQLYLFFNPIVNAAYYLPVKAAKSFAVERPKVEKTATWLRNHYNGGLVLISVYENDPKMFYFPIPYRNYIFEGTGKYWKESLKNPTKYASWVIIKNAPKPKRLGTSNIDVVSYYLKDEPILNDNYDLVYEDKLFLIYKIRGRPEIIINH